MPVDLMNLELTGTQFERVRELLYRMCGIDMHAGKEGLVKGRLMKRLRQLDIGSFDAYLRFVEEDPTRQELTSMIDVLTTNKTSFFREAQHFDFLKEEILPKLRVRGGSFRIWCAGCSTGEEPYTLAVVLREELPNVDALDIRILATDISTQVLSTAREAVYEAEKLSTVPPAILHKHFDLVPGSAKAYQANAGLRRMVQFARLNLMEEWPMQSKFDAIFCRNVMIYFDKPTQQRLVNRYWQYLKPGGHLFVGHSESLSAWAHQFRYVRPAVYAK